MNIVTIQKGNPYATPITVTTSTGTAYDLTGKTIFFTVKRVNDISNDDTQAVITATITPAMHTVPLTLGLSTLTLTAIQTNIATGEYKCDFRIYQAGVVQANSETFKVIVTDIVTKRIV